MINNRNQSEVTDMKWTSSGEKICIAYLDGTVIVGSVEGNRLWGKELGHGVTHCEWNPDGAKILFGTPSGEVKVYDAMGNSLYSIQNYLMKKNEEWRIASISWFDGGLNGYVSENYADAFATLCIAYSNGKIQLMKSENDDAPTLINTSISIKRAKWSPNGLILAVCGYIQEQTNIQFVIQFYTSAGQYLRSLSIAEKSLNDISWEGTGLQLALAVGNSILFARVHQPYKWSYFSKTLVFSYYRPDRSDECIVFWDISLDEKYVKYVRNLLQIQACGEYCVLITKGDTPNLWLLILCNSIGSPVDSREINIEPLYTSMSKTHIIICNKGVVYLWKYRKQSASNTIESEKNKKIGGETVFLIDQLPDSALVYDKDKFTQSDAPTPDPICAVCISNEAFIIGRNSGTAFKYTLPHIALESKFSVKCRPSIIALNCNSTKLSIIDSQCILSFYDLETHQQWKPKVQPQPNEGKDVWSILWSTDNPLSFVKMEKSRLYIMKGLEPEEPIPTNGYICEYSNLEAIVIQLDDMMKKIDQIKSIKEFITIHESKSLRDTKNILSQVSIKEAADYVEKNSHPRLWKLLAESALEKLDIPIAERAFVKLEDYYGLQLLKKLSVMDDNMKKKAEISIFFGQYDEAEQTYREIDRKDLALDLRRRIGDFPKVIQYIEAGVGNDKELLTAYSQMGDYYAEKKKWKKASNFYSLAQNYEKQITAFIRSEDYENLKKMLNIVPNESKVLEKLALAFQRIGMCECAKDAYLKMGDVKKAIDCCVLLNKWDMAVELAEKNNFLQIEGLISKYASHLLEKNQRIEVVELYRKVNRNTEAARMLIEFADELMKQSSDLILIKQIYVLAALEVESYKQRIYDAQMTNAGTAAKTIDTLITSDINTSTDKALSNPWKKAEAIHFYLLCQRQMYQT